ncbi:MAG: ABC transporter permease [Christensenellales bacterium]
MTKHQKLAELIIPAFAGDVIRFKINIDDNTILNPYNAGEYVTPNLKSEGFALSDIAIAYSFTGDSEPCNIPYVLDITDTATNSFSIGDSEKGRVNVTIDLYNDYFDKYSDELEALNYTLDSEYQSLVFLEPGIEYIGTVNMHHGRAINDEIGREIDCQNRVTHISFEPENLFADYSYRYTQSANETREYVSTISTKAHPFWLYKYEDVKNSPELSERFEQISRAYYINSRSFCVTTTNDVTGVPAFNVENMYMKGGRIISDEEYDSGAKVCMISKELATIQGWDIGTKIDFSFYEYGYFSNSSDELKPRYTYTSPDNFFDSGEYEVVGIYDVRPMTGSSTISEAAISVPWNTIYIPEKSLTNAPAEEDRPVTGALLTIWLENGKIEPFIERMNELGITGAKQGDYEARFTFYDQGYSRIQPSLEALSGTAELLLILSSSLLVIAALLLAFFYAQSQRQSIGTMRLLGCSKARAFAAVMLSAFIIAVTGALIGAAIGHVLTASVGESIMANANQTPEEFLAFSAYLAESTQVEVDFALGADVKVSFLTCIAALGLFIVGTLVFVLRYLGKGPRELLPRAGE